MSVGHTLAGASPAVVARSSDALRESRCVGAQVHTPEHGACSPRLQGSSPCSLSNAKNVNNASALRSCITYSAPLPGRGRVPSRLMSPKPKSMAGGQHGLPAGGSEALWSKGVQGEERFRRDCCLRNPSPWPAGSTGCRRGRLPPSWCGFRTRYETQGV